MNWKLLVKICLKIFITCAVLVLIGLWLRMRVGKEYFLADAANFGWIIGVIGTIYTLITAFVLFGVWNQYNTLQELIAKEARILAGLWNYTDYFNDSKLDKQMRESLVSYINKALEVEIKRLAGDQQVVTYSAELITINQVVDAVKFNDGRDGTIYSVVIELYKNLVDVRVQKNEAGITRLPLSIKALFIVLSLLLVFCVLILGFTNELMYIFSLLFVAIIVSLTYEVVQDMDNPFGGLFQLKQGTLEETKEYISRSQHH